MSKKQTEAMKLALERLQARTDTADLDAIAALNEALMSVPDGAEQLTHVQQEPGAIHQFRKRGCSDWYDGLPDHHDGQGPYEIRTFCTTPQAQPVQDSVAWCSQCGHKCPKPAFKQQEPVAWWSEKLGVFDEKHFDQLQPLYTFPPTRNPLTDEQVDRIADQHPAYLGSVYPHAFARAIEAAHGITK